MPKVEVGPVAEPPDSEPERLKLRHDSSDKRGPLVVDGRRPLHTAHTEHLHTLIGGWNRRVP